MTERKKGLWIAFEGNDGSGKSTQIFRVADYLRILGIDAVTTREPGGNPYSEKLRGMIFDPEIAQDPITQLYLFAGARRRNILKTVLPAVNEGKIVLSDRSQGSTFAYQHFQFGLPWEMVSYINSFATQGVRPDYTFLLDVDEEIGRERTRQAKGSEMNHFDQADLARLIRRRNGYLQLARKLDNWIIIDANQNEDKVFADIIRWSKQYKILEAYGIGAS